MATNQKRFVAADVCVDKRKSGAKAPLFNNRFERRVQPKR